MKLTLQQHYDLIKKGQGTKDIFLKEAKSLFPQYVPSNASVDSAISSLKYKGVIVVDLYYIRCAGYER
jgi:hypothetical protein